MSILTMLNIKNYIMKKILFYLLLINYIISIIYVIRNITIINYPIQNLYALSNTKKFIFNDTLYLKDVRYINSSKNTSTSIYILGIQKSNNNEREVYSVNKKYEKYNNKIPIRVNKINNEIFISDTKNRVHFIANAIMGVFFYISFILITFLIIYKFFKNKK